MTVSTVQYWRDKDYAYQPGNNSDGPTRLANILFGYSDGTSVTYVAVALTSGNLTLTLNGTDVRTISITTAIGADGGGAGYIDNSTLSGTLSGLTPFTKYSYTATFGADTWTGQFYTAPESGDNFYVYVNTCDRPVAFTGHYGPMRDEVENGLLPYPVVANFHIDDNFGYVDTKVVASVSSGTPNSTLTEHDYAVAYFDGFGLYGNTNAWGRNPTRQWCLNNINYIPQWGDHEFKDNFQGAITPFAANPMHATDGNFDGGGYLAYSKLMMPLQPPQLDRGGSTSTANHWACEYGEVCIVGSDSITEANGTNIYGTEQLEDILDKYNTTTCSHKIFLSGIRMSHDGSAYSLKQDNISEYNGLIRAIPAGTDALTNTSIMENDKTNGTLGNFVSLSGDLHSIYVLKHQKANASFHTEGYLDFELGTVDSSPTRATAGITGANLTALTEEDSVVEYQSGVGQEYASNSISCGGALIKVIGNSPYPELTVQLRHFGSDSFQGSVVTVVPDSTYSRKFIRFYTDNYGIAAETDRSSLGISAFLNNMSDDY